MSQLSQLHDMLINGLLKELSEVDGPASPAARKLAFDILRYYDVKALAVPGSAVDKLATTVQDNHLPFPREVG